MKKNAQMEIVGLAMIVILISLGLLFFIRFGLFKPPTTHSKEYEQSELAANFLNTLQDTNAPECSGVKFSTLFQDCATDKIIPCSKGGNSCIYIEQTMIEILSKTFDKWKVKYYFIASKDATDLKSSNETRIFQPIGDLSDCKGWKLGQQPLPLDTPGDYVYLLLYLCD